MHRTGIQVALFCLIAQLATPHALSQQEAVGSSNAAEQGSGAPATTVFPDLSIPAEANVESLKELVERAKNAKPASTQQYFAMQTAIRDASKKLQELLKGQEGSEEYLKAELNALSASVALMTFFGDDAKKKTLEQVHSFLKSRKQLTLNDVNTGWLAAVMLEMQPDKSPARSTYLLIDELLKTDQREEMQRFRLNVQAAMRRLDMLGKALKLETIDVDGNRVKTADYAGKYLLVNFFSASDPRCLEETRRIQGHYSRYHARGLEVIGISIDDDDEQLEAYLATAKLPWPVIHDNATELLARLRMKFGISTLPSTLLLNKEGTVVSLEALHSELDRLMQLLFDSPTPAAPPAADEKPAHPQQQSTNA